MGLLHPLAHLRGGAVRVLRAAGIAVDVLGEAACPVDAQAVEDCRRACLQANEVMPLPVLPFPVLKYMTTVVTQICSAHGRR